MTDNHDEHHDADEMPADPFGSHDAERITKEAGGETIAVLQRAGQDRLTVGAYTHPHNMPSLNTVTITMHLDGKQTDRVDLSLSEVQGLLTGLLEAVSECWGVPPGEALPPQYRPDEA